LLGGSSLTELTTDISSAANMVERLKRSEREKNLMKIQYEEKLAQQQQKIRETELERDQVLASLGKTFFLHCWPLTVFCHIVEWSTLCLNKRPTLTLAVTLLCLCQNYT